MRYPIIWTKLTPEQLQHPVLRRERLLRRLDVASQMRVVLLTAAAGYGKSVLLSSFVSQRRNPVVWYRLHEDDADPIRFLTHLVVGLHRQFPDAVGQTQRLLVSSANITLQRNNVLASLLEDLSAIRETEPLIIFDDYDNVARCSEISDCLDYLLKYLPVCFHVFVSSRMDHRTDEIVRLRQYGQLLELTENDLAFSSEEIHQIFNDFRGIALTEQQVQKLFERTAGWPAVLQMVLQHSSALDDAAALAFIDNFDGSDKRIYEYFAHHVLRCYQEGVQRFLERISVLSRLTPAVCDGVLGISNSGYLLRLLYQDHTFLSQIGSDTQYQEYHLHSLFRDFLRARLWEREGQAGVRELLARAGKLSEERGEVEFAIHYFSKAGMWTEVSRLIRSAAPAIIRIGQVSTVLAWLDGVPDRVVSADPWLLFYRGRILRLQDRVDEALPLQEVALELFRDQGDQKGIAQCLFELGVIHHYRNEPRNAIDSLEKAVASASSEPLLQVEGLSFLIVCYGRTGQFTSALRSGEIAFSLLSGIGDRQIRTLGQIEVLRRIARIHMRRGDVLAAVELARRAHELHRYDKNIDERVEAYTLFALAQVYSAKGEMESALKAAHQAEAIARKYRMDWMLSTLSGIEGQVLAMMQDYEAAEECYRRAGYPTNDYADTAYLRILQGRLDEAERILRAELAIVEEEGIEPELARVKALFGLMLAEKGQNAAARESFLNAATVFLRLDYRPRLAGVHLHLARLCLREREMAEARQYLNRALGFAAEKECYNFFLWAPEVIASVCAEALKEGIQMSCVVSLCSKRLGAAQASYFLPLLTHRDAGVRSGATEILRSISGAGAQSLLADGKLLQSCPDEDIKSRLLEAILNTRLTMEGLARLREEYGLTWRETDIFTQYYLPMPNTLADSQSRRDFLARDLCMTDNTLRIHINRIRRKLGIVGRRSGISIYEWALNRCITQSVLQNRT